VSKAPVGLIDLYPTLTDLCRVDRLANLQGQSLVPMLRDSSAKGRGWALSQVTRGVRQPKNAGRRTFGYSLRTPRWRYTEWDEGRQGAELYDHDQDSKELTNLVNDEAYKSTVAGLKVQLHAAVEESFPVSGATPTLHEGPPWAPILTKP
jgi:iduronate 2-sulfatase